MERPATRLSFSCTCFFPSAAWSSGTSCSLGEGEGGSGQNNHPWRGAGGEDYLSAGGLGFGGRVDAIGLRGMKCQEPGKDQIFIGNTVTGL